MSVDEKMTAIADQARRLSGGTDTLGLDEMATVLSGVIDAKALMDGSITELTSDVATIRDYAFYGCENLETANLPNITVLPAYGFANSKKLKTLNTPKCTTIKGFALSHCEKLSEFIGTNVTSIESRAFVDCYGLVKVELPKCTTIPRLAFSPFNTVFDWSLIVPITSSSFPNVTTVEAFAFSDSAFTSLYLPRVASVPQRAFGGKYLESLSLPIATTIVTGSCPALKTINFPKATNVDIQNCSAIEAVSLPVATEINARNCSSLKSLTAPKVTSLRLSKCTSLETFDMSDYPTLAECPSFEGCTGLKTVRWNAKSYFYPGSTQHFKDCVNLTALIIPVEGTVKSRDTSHPDPFEGSAIANGTGYIYVPASTIDGYKDVEQSGWFATYASQFRALEDYTVDGTITGELDPNKI